MTRLALIASLALIAATTEARQPIVGIIGNPHGYHGRNVTVSGYVRSSEMVALGNWKFGLVFQIADQEGNCVWAFSEEPPNDQTLQAMKAGLLVKVGGTFYRVYTVGGTQRNNLVLTNSRNMKCDLEGEGWKLLFDLLKKD